MLCMLCMYACILSVCAAPNVPQFSHTFAALLFVVVYELRMCNDAHPFKPSIAAGLSMHRILRTGSKQPYSSNVMYAMYVCMHSVCMRRSKCSAILAHFCCSIICRRVRTAHVQRCTTLPPACFNHNRLWRRHTCVVRPRYILAT